MALLKVLIPLFIILGFLQVAIMALPFIYMNFHPHMGRINKYLFGALLFVSPSPVHTYPNNSKTKTFTPLNAMLTSHRIFTALILHPLLVIVLITFTIAPTLLSLRHNIFSHLSTSYTSLIPQTLPSISKSLGQGLPKSNKEWIVTLLGGYTGWKVMGTMPSLVVL
jgi:hypothetical protein